MNTRQNTFGFTLYEMMVVIIVGSIVIFLSFKMYEFVHQRFDHDMNRSYQSGEYFRGMELLRDDILLTSSVFLSRDTLKLMRIDGRYIVYSHTNGNLFRNGDPMLSCDSVLFTQSDVSNGVVVNIFSNSGSNTIKQMQLESAQMTFYRQAPHNETQSDKR